jgi:CheY-like chemotaxis protein
MGGAITVESVYSKGSTFSFCVLCEAAEQVPGEQLLETGEKLAEVKESRKLRILGYEPNIYNTQALDENAAILQVPHDICNDLETLGDLLAKNTYTHILFDSSAREVIAHTLVSGSSPTGSTGFTAGIIGETRYILIKNMQEKYEDSPEHVLNRPILSFTLADKLKEHHNQGQKTEKTAPKNTNTFRVMDASVLVVDDNKVNLAVAKGLLRKYGIQAETAPGGSEAIEMLKQKEYNLVFMDHMMPGMDGIEATRAIRALEGRFATQIIVALTANAVSGMEELFIESGMDGFLSKPIIISKLEEILLKYLPSEKIIE